MSETNEAEQSEPPPTISDPLADYLFLKAGLSQEKTLEVVRLVHYFQAENSHNVEALMAAQRTANKAAGIDESKLPTLLDLKGCLSEQPAHSDPLADTDEPATHEQLAEIGRRVAAIVSQPAAAEAAEPSDLPHGPFAVMCGAPWNVLDSRGVRIALCGGDSNADWETHGPAIAATIVAALNAKSCEQSEPASVEQQIKPLSVVAFVDDPVQIVWIKKDGEQVKADEVKFEQPASAASEKGCITKDEMLQRLTDDNQAMRRQLNAIREVLRNG